VRANFAEHPFYALRAIHEANGRQCGCEYPLGKEEAGGIRVFHQPGNYAPRLGAVGLALGLGAAKRAKSP